MPETEPLPRVTYELAQIACELGYVPPPLLSPHVFVDSSRFKCWRSAFSKPILERLDSFQCPTVTWLEAREYDGAGSPFSVGGKACPEKPGWLFCVPSHRTRTVLQPRPSSSFGRRGPPSSMPCRRDLSAISGDRPSPKETPKYGSLACLCRCMQLDHRPGSGHFRARESQGLSPRARWSEGRRTRSRRFAPAASHR